MKTPSQMSRTATLVEGALMIALAFALSCVPFFKMPWGGTVTCFSTLPIIIMSFRHGIKWGVGTAFVYGVLQTFQGLDSVVAAKTVWGMILCVLLDYVVAYACVGLSGPIANRFKHHTAGLVIGIAATGALRLACSFVSGLVIWYSYAPAGQPVWLYSLSYNAGWCLPDVAIVLVATLLLSRVRVLHILPEAKASASEA